MRHSILSLMAAILLAISVAGCAGVGGSGPIDLPSNEIGFTEVGNPDEEETLMKGVYVNEEFDVRIEYPAVWDIDERGDREAEFFSEIESVTATFVWLREGESFEDFLLDARGGEDGLRTYTGTEFELSKCSIDGGDDGMIPVECYHYNVAISGDAYVLILTGYVLTETGLEAVIARPMTENKAMSKAPGYSHTSPIAAAGDDSKPELPKFGIHKPVRTKPVIRKGM